MKQETGQGGSASRPRPEDDPNWLAYKAQEAELKANHMGKWVAFHNGELAMIADDFDSLQKRMWEEKHVAGFMYHQIVEKERVIHLRSPRRVSPRH